MAEDIFTADVKFTPFWWLAAPRPDETVANVPHTADVAVIGAGYSGLSAALTIARDGRSVVVLEADRPGEGASSRNGGAVGATLRHSFATLKKMHGLETALRFYRETRAGRAWLKDFIAKERIDCDFHPVGRFIGCHRKKDYEILARDLDLQAKHLGTEGEMVPPEDQHRFVGTDAYFGGRFLAEDANLHPGKLHQGLLQRVQAEGVPVVGRSRVTAINREDDGFSLEYGVRTLKARQLVIATNGYTGGESPWLRRRVLPMQSQIIATEPLDTEVMTRLMPDNRQLGDTCRLHYYYRAAPDHDRILFGGRAGAAEINDRRKSGRLLYRRLVQVFPELAGTKITHSWGGFIAYTFDHMLHLAENDGIFYVAGFCGSGVVNANYLGHKTGLKVLGQKDGETIFDSEHPTHPVYAGNPWFLAPVIALKNWQDRLRI
ncbi:MAG: FAD-dependent oxidoreductase [Rhodospirillaceae bacterium]|nr:FAD-dependent oxidoreductase [Rhodospirillaceae bacterium]